MATYGEAYLLEKLELVRAYQSQGKITSTEAKFLIAAVRDDYKSDQSVADAKRKQLREAARLQQEAERIESEKAMESQRLKRETSRAAVQSHLD